MRVASSLLGAFLGVWLASGGTNAAENVPYHGTASFYGLEACRVNPDPRCPTASGRSLYDLSTAHVPYMAARFGTFGSWWQVCGPVGCTHAVLLDRGPARRLNRLADLAPEVFVKVCGVLSVGVCPVTITVVSPP